MKKESARVTTIMLSYLLILKSEHFFINIACDNTLQDSIYIRWFAVMSQYAKGLDRWKSQFKNVKFIIEFSLHHLKVG